jgi:hypothetical protein
MTLPEVWDRFLSEVDDEDGDITPSAVARLVLYISEDVTKDHRMRDVDGPSLNDVIERLLDC